MANNLNQPGKPAGIGIDIVEMSRIRRIRFPERFAEYFLCPREIAALKRHADPVAFIASRFALKEAVIKAFPHFLKPHDFEIVKRGKKPYIRFSAGKHNTAYSVMASISHSTEYAAGYAVVMSI